MVGCDSANRDQRHPGIKSRPVLRFDTVGKSADHSVGSERRLRVLDAGSRSTRSLDLFDGDRFDDHVIERFVATIGCHQAKLVYNLA